MPRRQVIMPIHGQRATNINTPLLDRIGGASVRVLDFVGGNASFCSISVSNVGHAVIGCAET